jgi:hypothetical protein
VRCFLPVHLGLLHDCGSIDDQTYNYFHAEYNTLGKKLNNWLMRIETFSASSVAKVPSS